MLYHVPHFINGAAVKNTPEQNDYSITNPALGKAIGSIGFADTTLCDKAISAAKAAWPSWSQTPPIKRVQVLFAFRTLLITHRPTLAQLVSQEHGKTLDDACASIARGIELVEYHCGLLSQISEHHTASVGTHVDCTTLRQSLGVCVGISPFNFPVMVPLWMMIPAIACGNTFVLKPSEQTPSASIRLLELLTEAGLPPGVVNCVQGDKNTVTYLIEHPDVAAVTAVASTPVAESIYRTATYHGKRAHTFGGAKNHAVVMPDADIKQAAAAIVGAAYGSAGERCMAISVVVAVGDETADVLVDALRTPLQSMVIDSGDVPGCEMGPLISESHRNRVMAAIEQGVNEGGVLVTDGRDFKHAKNAQGYFLGPSLFDRVTPDMSIYQKELFGPVLVVVRVDNFEEALSLVNQNQYGNGTAIFTRDGFYAREYTQRVQVGMVGINIPIPVPVASHPFGGWKRSSFGDTNMHGRESIHFYTQLKTVTSQWLADKNEGNIFSMPTHS